MRLGAGTVFATVTGILATVVVLSFALSLEAWTPMAAVALPLVAASALWIAAGAATAVLGLTPGRRSLPVPEGWRPAGTTAVLLTLCREDPVPVAVHLAGLRRALDRAGLGPATRIFVLSDTRGEMEVAAEEEALGPLMRSGAITYRRRTVNDRQKPGNIADWLDRWGAEFDYMLVLDADSRMSANRIRRLIRTIEARPRLGLLQAGIALTPGRTRFGRHQRVAARLLGPTFVRGFAAWAGRTSNYWGHNAILRVEAFRAAAELPILPGRAPFGGSILSHDFVEAAWIRRAGWDVELDITQGGSAEDAPQTLEEFHRRDRRWCQGNLQHIRLLTEPGLHPLSRLHMLSGVFSYLAAPVWLALLLMTTSRAVTVTSLAPVVLVALLLLLPKLCGLGAYLRRRMTPWRASVCLRAALAEIAVSAILAPVMMVRQSGAVLLVLAGRDAGWKSGRRARDLPKGVPESLAGGAVGGLAVVAGGWTALWLAPIVLSLLCAPILIRYLDGTPDATA
jgi:membrane glycosyltransferase